MKRLFVASAALLVVLASAGALAADCVDVGLEAEMIPGDPHGFLRLTWWVENCGDAAGRARFDFTLNRGLERVASMSFTANLHAGVRYDGTLKLPVVCCIPAGTYTLCMRAELGSSMDLACASITVDEMNNITAFTPIPAPIATEAATWGAIKAIYR